MASTDFHEVVFPLAIALQGRGGPRRKTDIVTTGSGREERNAKWAQSRRFYDAGSGVKTLADLAQLIAFFEERRGRLYGFRWRDRMDDRSCSPGFTPAPTDQHIATGDGATKVFQLVKIYGGQFAPYRRTIRKPVDGTVMLAVNGTRVEPGVAYQCDPTTGLIMFAPNAIPRFGTKITAGFRFDVPVRFDTDELSVDLSAFIAGEVPSIPLVEITG
jgi:uncharacterized protein (TIGR02217 family)